MDDLTCPSLLIEEDSDYGSRDTSDNDDFVIGGFCTIFSHLDGKGEINLVKQGEVEICQAQVEPC